MVFPLTLVAFPLTMEHHIAIVGSEHFLFESTAKTTANISSSNPSSSFGFSQIDYASPPNPPI